MRAQPCVKIPYRTPDQARQEARAGGDKGQLRPYSCSACSTPGGVVYHLTSISKARLRQVHRTADRRWRESRLAAETIPPGTWDDRAYVPNAAEDQP
jgi:hypothetical protein